MVAEPSSDGFNCFLAELHQSISVGHPHLIDLFEVFAQEARFGRRWLAASLLGLPRGSDILEVGGGLMLLSVQLQREGYQVTALEPIGAGFSSFIELQSLVLKFATAAGYAPVVLPVAVENLTIKGVFDFAFSVNVMEHVSRVDRALSNVLSALKLGRIYRFTCPNYTFPYEPHFNIPTLFSKILTERLFRVQIFNSRRVADPAGMWASLNWISVWSVSRAVARIPGGVVRFERSILRDILVRVVVDDQFASRRSVWVKVFVRLIVRCRVHHLLLRLPASLSPIMDCSVLQM